MECFVYKKNEIIHKKWSHGDIHHYQFIDYKIILMTTFPKMKDEHSLKEYFPCILNFKKEFGKCHFLICTYLFIIFHCFNSSMYIYENMALPKAPESPWFWLKYKEPGINIVNWDLKEFWAIKFAIVKYI